MADWEDSDEEPVVPVKTVAAPKRSKWEGEDEEEAVADEWDASSDDDVPVPVAPVVAPKKKGTLKAKIAEKEAERARREAAGESAEEESEIDEREQRRIDRARELDTDLINATALLGGSSIAGPPSAAVQGITSLNPKTPAEWDELSRQLIDLIKRHQDKPLYATFVASHVKELAQPLKDVDVRKVASGLTTLANEKQKEQRDKASGKKKPKAAAKPALGGAKSTTKVDTGLYDEALDDFGNDDFM